MTVIPILIGALGTVTKGLVLLFPSPPVSKTGGLGNKSISGDHPNYSIVEIGQNTEKSPGDLRRLAVTQTAVENHQRT